MNFVQRSLKPIVPYSTSRPFSRVELHVHLDGVVRHETIYELLLKKDLALPGDGSFADLQYYLVEKTGVSLNSFLEKFPTILAPFIGDLKNIERMAYEAVEDGAKQGILYFKARFCPHLLVPEKITDVNEIKSWIWSTTCAAIKGLEKGQNDFKTRGNLILTCIRGFPPHTFEHSLELAKDSHFHRGRIVGVDLAGVAGDNFDENQMRNDEVVNFCQQAAKLGINRTVHAGESGDASEVEFALDHLHAERIGHGYRIVNSKSTYERVQKNNVHLETCPWSSLLTASVKSDTHPHPIVQFFEDEFNVSVNTDDPTITGTKLDDEFNLLRAWGLSDAHFVRASFNAARSCFLREDERKDLVQDLVKTYGFIK